MRTKEILIRALLPLAAAAAWWLLQVPALEAQQPQVRWYKGNLHTHTLNSDGDSTPDAVARWYRENRYNFLVLTDHNFFTDPAALNTFMGAQEKFLLIPGEEVTSKFEAKPIHVNAFDISRLVEPVFGANVVETIQGNVNAIAAANGLASLNHPNFGWAVMPDEFKQVSGLKLFEVYNGHPTVHNVGGGGAPSLEAMWDVALTAGREIFGIAVDDAHVFRVFGPQYSNPGRGWVTVKAPALSSAAIRAGLERGDFYSSTGVELAEVERSGKKLRVRIEQKGNFKYTTEFIGADSRLLYRSYEIDSEYALKSGERYVRARVTDSMGNQAWTQPVFAQ